MQRKPGYPVANCNIKMPEHIVSSEAPLAEDESEHIQRRQLLINFGHSQWGFNNWNWSVSKQELDFVDFANGKFTAGVVAFVSISVKTLDIHRENIGYSTSQASSKGLAIYKSRKCAVTNALRETLLAFGGGVATELLELLEADRRKIDTASPAEPAPAPEADVGKRPEPRNSPLVANPRKEDGGRPPPAVKNAAAPPVVRVAPPPAPPANLPPAANRAPPANAARGPPPPPVPPPPPRPPNEPLKPLENMSDEEARAERKRRQRLAQEEFRQKQLMKHKTDDKEQLVKTSTSFDTLLMDVKTQDLVIEDSGAVSDETGKRKSPAPDNVAKRRAGFSKLDIIETG